MADAVDRPRTGAGEFTPALPAGQIGPDAIRDAAAGPAYRPLSLTAVVGFALAVLYGVFVVLGSLFTFMTGDHFLLPSWTLLLPVSVILISLLGRAAINASEGALGGAKLANWGIGLTVVCALGYWSYYAATMLALRQQSVAFADAQFIPALRQGNIEKAFLLTFTPPRPEMPAADLRKFIEQNINMPPSLKSPGRFTIFSQTDYVHMMQMGLEATKVDLVSVGVPTQERGGMEVALRYRVQTPAKSFDLQVVTRALESASGREWQVMENKTGTVMNSTAWNPDGSVLFQKNEPAAREFANGWLAKIASKLDTEGAYLGTLPPDLRARLAPKLKGKGDAQLAREAANDPELRDYLAGLNAFRTGGVVRADPNLFWAPDNARDKVVEAVKKKFLTAYATNGWATLALAPPLWEVKDKKVRFYYDLYIVLLPEYMAGARLVLEANADPLTADVAADPDAWRVVSIDMLRSHAAPKPETQKAGQ
jgi:hypothetical protein